MKNSDRHQFRSVHQYSNATYRKSSLWHHKKINRFRSISFQTIFHLYPPFCLQHISRTKDVVIPITLKYGNQSRTFSYTILTEEAVPIAPVVAAQPVAPESTPVPVPDKSDLIMVVLDAAVIRITLIIGISVFQIKRPHSREK
uniref:Uncharacterized protein n=1 Tax=Candidatus Methanophaga sp. ANME-1 ERB7 TaxID=2759913 RepID=A0A7G9ZD50_9EURY|nr:hypothetical protein MFNKIFOF_00005 [Methanosarcinales archaeon ANME-1 ERB7]